MPPPQHQVAWLTAAVALAAARPAPAQDLYLGAAIGTFLGGGRGVASHCAETSSRTGITITIGRGLWRSLLSVQATTQLHLWRQGPTCALYAEEPPNGTYTVLDGAKLLESRFAATDVRLRIHGEAGGIGGSLTLGGGVAWRAGPNVPYVAAGATVAAPLGRYWFVVEGELYHLRMRLDFVERSYVDYQLVSVVPLPTVREWSSAGRVAVGVLVPVDF